LKNRDTKESWEQKWLVSLEEQRHTKEWDWLTKKPNTVYKSGTTVHKQNTNNIPDNGGGGASMLRNAFYCCSHKTGWHVDNDYKRKNKIIL